jgi:hypothetical protein
MPIKKKNKSSQKKKKTMNPYPTVLVEANCTASFTCLLDITTTYSAGVSGYQNTLLASNFTGLNAFQALFQYYLPRRANATFTLRTANDNGGLVRFRPLDPLIDASFSGSVTDPVTLASDPSTIQCIANKVNSTGVITYKNQLSRFSTASATSDKLGSVWVTLPVAQDPSGTMTTVITVHLVVTFYRKASQAPGS